MEYVDWWRTDSGDSLIFIGRIQGCQFTTTQVFMTSQMVSMMFWRINQFDLDGIFDVPDVTSDLFCVVLHPLCCLVEQVGFAANPVIRESGSIIGVDILSLVVDINPMTNPMQVVDAVVVVEVS